MTSHVLLVGPVPPPVGGVATHVRELGRALTARGVHVDTIDPRRDGPDGRDGRPRLLYALARAALRGSVVHLHTNGHNRKSWTLAALCATAGLAHRRNATVLTLHSGLAPAYMRAHLSTVRAIASRYSYVVAVNDELAAVLAEAGLEPERVVLQPAFSPSQLAFRVPPPGLRRIRARHPLLLAATVVAGAPEYGEDVLLDAFARVQALRSDAGLILYGPGTRDPALADEVRRRGLSRHVYLMGPLERERGLAVLAACDLFVRPTRADGDALSVREALALGTPVVASDVGCRPPEATLFPVGDAVACAETIFHTVGNGTVPRVLPTASGVDCIPALLAIYQRCGLLLPAGTTGTAFATVG